MTSTAVVGIEDLVKDYSGLRPLRLKQLVVMPGERVALSGLDAIAAEVLVNLVNGAILPDKGDVHVFGRSTAAIADETEWLESLDGFGIVTTRAVLLETATVRQNLALPFTIELDDPGEEVVARGAALAAEVDIPAGSLDTPVHTLPPEGRMRIHLARSLATDPRLLLLEHPTVSMARETVADFAAVVKRIAIARGLTLLLITEDNAFADRLATAQYRVQGGTGALVNARGWRRWL